MQVELHALVNRLRIPLEQFIRQAPEFDGDKELAVALGEAIADLFSYIID